MSPFLASLLSWLTFPVYVVQGVWVRQRSLRLSPAEGPLSGKVGQGEPDLRILVVGDSSAAAVGIENTADAIAPQIAKQLSDQSGKTVSWLMSGHNSAVANEIRDHVVPNLEPAEYTHIFIMLGTNDMKNFHSVRRWKRDFGSLLYVLRTRFPEAQVLWHQAIDMRNVPNIPQPLATFMNWRRMLLNRKGAQLCVERGVVAVPPLPDVRAEGFCRDGFHASSEGYAAWAKHYVDHVEYTPRTTPAARPHI